MCEQEHCGKAERLRQELLALLQQQGGLSEAAVQEQGLSRASLSRLTLSVLLSSATELDAVATEAPAALCLPPDVAPRPIGGAGGSSAASAKQEEEEAKEEVLDWGRGAGAQGLAAAAEASLARGGRFSLLPTEAELQQQSSAGAAGAAALLGQQLQLRARLCAIMAGPPDQLPPLRPQSE